ncbi:MAG: hypothetical protein HGA45_44565, partial [Chloroflexales bacterium]|nr:hypothetical protein [Chloroflexales bacterium]
GQLVSIVAVAPSPAGSWLAWGQEPAAVEGVDAIGSIYARRLSAAGYTVALPMLARP